MSSQVFVIILGLTGFVAGRDLSQFAVIGDGTNLGGALVQTEATVPVYTPGQMGETFDTVLETNFTTGAGRFLGVRDTFAQTAGPGQQISGGQSNISSILRTGGFFLTGGSGVVQAGSGSVGANGTFGATFTNTTNQVISLTGTGPPHGTFVQNGFETGAIRSDAGQLFSQGISRADSGAADYDQDLIATQSSSVGASSASITGLDTLTFASGNTFSVSAAETVTGCEQAAGAASYGADVGLNGTTATACSSRGSFQGVRK
eukprot:TRINITY_DN155_c0_g1_i2.p3 TRINITY_DN155_c0_g1~~TRINITY_DN155_c0_g1_i2.p3  ORF type:complete len:261 (-),score=43.42 TRINITY_DN155_c0_g1_i2:273-1055(-)